MQHPRNRLTRSTLGLLLILCAMTSCKLFTRPTVALVDGTTEAGFEQVLAEFERNFTDRGEVGASLCVYFEGRPVAHLWGGHADAEDQTRWTETTLVPLLDATMGVTATAMAHAHSQGWLDYDQPVATYWPDFAQSGKGGITVRQLLAHQAGLVLVDPPVLLDDASDLHLLAGRLAAQTPAWTAGQRHGYHRATLGLYAAEILRRADPSGRTLGTYVREEITEPLGIEMYIGLPADVPGQRVAFLALPDPILRVFQLNKLPEAMRSLRADPTSLLNRSRRVPGDFHANDRHSWSVEHGSLGGVATASALAQLYGELATGGSMLGIEEGTFRLLQAQASPPPGGDMDEILGVETAYANGFVKPSPHRDYGSSSAFGHPGEGATMAFADPDLKLGYAYLPQRLGYHVADDPRDEALREAARRCARDALAAR